MLVEKGGGEISLMMVRLEVVKLPLEQITKLGLFGTCTLAVGAGEGGGLIVVQGELHRRRLRHQFGTKTCAWHSIKAKSTRTVNLRVPAQKTSSDSRLRRRTS